MFVRMAAGTRAIRKPAARSGCRRTTPRSSPPSGRCPATTGWSPTAPETMKRQAPGWRERCNKPAGRILAAHGRGEICVKQSISRSIVALLELDLHDAVAGDGDPRIHLIGGREIAVHDYRAAPRGAVIRRAAESHIRVTGAIVPPDHVDRPLRCHGDRRE